jgi:hypothetical protein
MTTPSTQPFTTFLSTSLSLEPGRQARAQEILRNGWVTIAHLDPDRVRAVISGHYTTEIDCANGKATCSCPDFNKRGGHYACKHLIALAQAGDNRLPGGATTSVPAQPVEEVTPVPLDPHPDLPDFDAEAGSFRERVRSAIGHAIAGLADLVEACLLAGEIPFLIGPTGCGKTSAVRLVAVRNGWGFEELAGSESFADADLLGLRTDHMEQPGVLARAFRRAREGAEVCLFLDEALRFNTRALDLLMRPVQSTPVSVAKAMGIPATEPVRLVEAPLWGVEWAPVARVHMVLAANPWGSLPDPALIRRVWPLPVSLDETVAALFDSPLSDAIRASWHGVSQGELPLPIEYQALTRARTPQDTAVLRAYLVRLSAVDKAAALGFKAVVEGIGVSL